MTETRPSPFSANIPNFQISWDSTSLGWLKTCPRLYQYQMLDQWSPKSKGIHLYFGGIYASGVERYAHSRADGMSHLDAVVAMVRWVLNATGTRDETGTFTPWDSGDAYKNRYTLVRSLVWNCEDRLNSPLKTVILANGKPAVELTFNFPAFEVEGETISLSGHMDELVEAEGSVWVKDDKAQPTFCNVLTPTGWTEIGKLNLGDLIAGRDGKFYPVTAIIPKGVTKAFYVEFEDHSHTYCGIDHLWDVAVSGYDNWKTLTTRDIIQKLATTSYKFHIPVCAPVQHPEAALPVDPYLLGALLGDGYLGGNSVQISTANLDLVEELEHAVARMGDILRKSPANNLVYTITRNRNCATLQGLKALGLWGKLSAAKFVPDVYLFASEAQRREILRGLMDTDGSWAGKGRRYQTMSEQLAQDVASLVRSLGGVAAVTLQPRKMYRVVIRMEERGTKPRRRFFRHFFPIPDCETVCISIASSDKLYITDNYIVTHNTTKGPLSAQYFKQYTPHNQMSLYATAGRVILDKPVRGVIIRAAQIGVGFTRFQTGQAPRPAAVLAEWLDETKAWVSLAREYALKDHWPMNDKSCADYGGCPFQTVCSVSPSHREAWLKDGFTKREWNPLIPRGEDF